MPTGGCAQDAMRQLSKGAAVADPGIAETLQVNTYAQMERDSRVVRAVAEWSRCMKAQRFDYPSPKAAAADQRWQTAKPGKPEIAVATADVACKTQTRVAGTMLAVETAYQQRSMAKVSTQLAAVKKLLDTQIANAKLVTSTGTAR
ncbi:hypothetical protein [Paractinoplanes durhamensis]|uniref:hypothetical protein n=1 Tax=Paractinoplanes durhamensis TaxID=113563 RepID=UPI003640783B